jgi:hypothetical protein
MNNNKYPHLTSSIQLGKVTFRNRIFSVPIWLLQAYRNPVVPCIMSAVVVILLVL